MCDSSRPKHSDCDKSRRKHHDGPRYQCDEYHECPKGCTGPEGKMGPRGCMGPPGPRGFADADPAQFVDAKFVYTAATPPLVAPFGIVDAAGYMVFNSAHTSSTAGSPVATISTNGTPFQILKSGRYEVNVDLVDPFTVAAGAAIELRKSPTASFATYTTIGKINVAGPDTSFGVSFDVDIDLSTGPAYLAVDLTGFTLTAPVSGSQVSRIKITRVDGW